MFLCTVFFLTSLAFSAVAQFCPDQSPQVCICTEEPFCYCDPPGQPIDDNQYCGGGEGPDDPWEQISCTPFTYRPNTHLLSKKLDPASCTGNQYYDVMVNGGDRGGSSWNNRQTNVWASDPSKWPDTTDYYVFHGCDSAGLQTDCVGDINYVERFSNKLDYDDAGVTIQDGKVVSGDFPEEGIVMDDGYYAFRHPATMTVHSQYVGGWLGDAECEDNDPASVHAFGDSDMPCILKWMCESAASGGWSGPLCDNVFTIPDTFFGGNHPFAAEPGHKFSFWLYPWTCYDAGGNENNLFSYPHISNFGWKCYVDNEPPAPQYSEVYFGLLAEDGKSMKLYRFNTGPEPNYEMSFVNEGNPYVIYNVGQNDLETNETMSNENENMPDENITMPDENITMPDENITLPDENTTMPNENEEMPANDATMADNETVPPPVDAVEARGTSGAPHNAVPALMSILAASAEFVRCFLA